MIDELDLTTLTDVRELNLKELPELKSTSTKYLEWYVAMMEKKGRPKEDYWRSKLELEFRRTEE